MDQEIYKFIEKIVIGLAVQSKKLRRARAMADRLEELYFDISSSQDAMIQMLRDCGALNHLSKNRAVSLLTVARSIRQATDNSSFETISLVPLANGKFKACISGRPPMLLSARVGDFLEILLETKGDRWQSVEAIQAALKKKTRKEHSRESVEELAYRLRDRLMKYGENLFWVQSRRPLSYRFALRRAPETVTGGGHSRVSQ